VDGASVFDATAGLPGTTGASGAAVGGVDGAAGGSLLGTDGCAWVWSSSSANGCAAADPLAACCRAGTRADEDDWATAGSDATAGTETSFCCEFQHLRCNHQATCKAEEFQWITEMEPASRPASAAVHRQDLPTSPKCPYC